MPPKRFIFWDHYDATMGGIEKMSVTLARDLSARHEVTIIARAGGSIVQALEGTDAEFTLVAPDRLRAAEHITSDDLLIDFGTFREFAELPANPHLLVWRVYSEFGCKGVLGRLLFRMMLRKLDRTDSLVFMDEGCYENSCNTLGLRLHKRLLPLPIIVRENSYVVDRPRSNINFTYVGRGSRMHKVHPVKKLVVDLGKVTSEQFRVHVFTDSDELFKKAMAGSIPSNVEVAYHFGYTMEALSRKLVELSDIHYSMGTACLEGAVLGIPTIIADASNSDFPHDYRYRWLIEDIENYAGGFLEYAKPGTHTIEEVVAIVREPTELERISSASYQQTTTNHGSDNIARALEELDPRARVSDALKFMPSYWRSGGPFRGHR